jgi:predicted O-methyltransferase YrrM
MKWEDDLVKDIRTHSYIDDMDGNVVAHPLGYGHTFDNHGNVIYPVEVTDCNRFHLLEAFMRVRDNAKSILEIGIGRNGQRSFSYVFLNNKKKDTIYIGIDTEDRSFLNNQDNNIHTITADSSNYHDNVSRFKDLGVEKFDFIFIDGWHSINQVLRDWEYTNLLADDGIVGFHDTSCHPGPHYFINALDQTTCVVQKNMCPDDWGIGFAWKRWRNN